MNRPPGNPTFSVVVPAFNAERRIGQTMHSVLGQSHSDLELLVVDDGSEDGTAAAAEVVARADPRVRVIRQDNAGTVAARNVGIAAVRGRYVSFLDDDDLWLPGYLASVARSFESEPGAGLVYGDAWVLDAASGLVGRRSALERFALPIRRLPAAPSPARSEAALLRVNFVTTCAATVSRDALDSVGELDPAIVGCDDWDLWLRIVGAGFQATRAEGRFAVLRKRGDSVGADGQLMARGARLVLERALERGVAGTRARRVARRHARLIELELALAERESPLTWPAAAARRVGRKRLPLAGGGWRQPSAELRSLIAGP